MFFLKKNTDNGRPNKIPEVPWNILDLFIIFSLLVFCIIVLFSLISLSVEQQYTEFKLFSCISPVIGLFVIYFWLKQKYNISWETLGLRRGYFSIWISIIFGFIVSVIMISTANLMSITDTSFVKNPSVNYFAAVLIPLTPLGFSKYILTPFFEEILFRGVLYGYLRCKVSITKAGFLQAVFSTLMHLVYVKDALQMNSYGMIFYLLIISLIFGLLYEKTNSIYSSVVCHGLVNFWSFLSSL